MSQFRLSYPPVAVDFMNRDHQEFAERRERLLEHIVGGAADAIDKLLEELYEHTVRHFADEEKLMQDTGFPVFPVHKGEHDSVLADMAQRIGHWKSGRDLAALRDWLEHAVGDWFVAHVASMDTVTARFATGKQGAPA